jgi:hypothetical protein
MKLEAGVRVERLTLDFVRVLNLYTQQLADYSSTIRPYPITAHSVHVYWQFYWQCCPSRYGNPSACACGGRAKSGQTSFFTGQGCVSIGMNTWPRQDAAKRRCQGQNAELLEGMGFSVAYLF